MLVNIGRFEDVASPLDLIKRILESGEFSVADTDHEPGPGERIIGEVNDEEKAIRAALIMISDTGRKFTADLEDALLANPYRASIDQLWQQNFLLKEWAGAAKSLFWATLKGRYAEEFHDGQNVAIGICSGFRVSVAPVEEKDPLSDLLAAMFDDDAFERAFGGMGVEAHDCANCPSYNICFLPDKKPLDQIAAERAAAAGTAS